MMISRARLPECQHRTTIPKMGVLPDGDYPRGRSAHDFLIRRVSLSLLAACLLGAGGCSTTAHGARLGRKPDARLVEGLRRQGLEAFRDGDFQTAALRLSQFIDAAPDNPEVKVMLARLKTVGGFVSQARGAEEVQTYVRKGVINYVEGRDLKGAVNALRYAFIKDPKDDKLLALLNLVEREAGVREVTGRTEGPGFDEFVDQKVYDARQAIYDGKYDLAVRRSQDILDQEPTNVMVLEIMGSAFFLMGEKAKAKAVWKKVLELDPRNKIVAAFLKEVQ